MIRERNILLTSIYEKSNRKVNGYYFLDDGAQIKYCDGLIKSEAGAKYILSNIDIDEIIVIGNSNVSTTDEIKNPIKLKDFAKTNMATIDNLSEYGYFCYRISEFLEEINLERVDLAELISEDRRNEINNLYKEFCTNVQSKSEDIRPNRMFHYLSQDENIYIEFANKFKDLTELEFNWLKDFIFTQLSNNYKLNSIESNSDICVKFIPISNTDTKYSSMQNIKGIINAFEFKDNEKINIYMDMQGLVKSDGYTLLSILSMLSNNENSELKVKEIITTQGNKTNFVHKIDNTALKQYEIYKLVSGINSFIKYGKVDMIEEYWNSRNIENEHIDKLIYAMKYVDEGISLCNIPDIEYGIAMLKKVFAETVADELNELESNIFVMLEHGIKLDYGSLLDGDKIDTLELIKWSYKKGLYQQVFTIIESKVPDDFVNRGIIYYANDDESKQNFLMNLNEWYWFSLPKDRYQFSDISHYFIKYYCMEVFHSINKNRKADKNELYVKYRLDKLDAADEFAVKAFSRLNGKRDLLKELLVKYLKIGEVRNKISHADGNNSLFLNEIDVNIKNNNIKLVKEAIEQFIYIYEKTIKELDSLLDKYNVVKITSDEFYAYVSDNFERGILASISDGPLFQFRKDPYIRYEREKKSKQKIDIDNEAVKEAYVSSKDKDGFKELDLKIVYKNL